MKLLTTYKNGNYKVFIFDDGTKVRTLDEGETEFKPKFPENIDCKISDLCSIGCAFCSENSSKKGSTIDLKDKQVELFINSLNDWTEIALGGGALSELPEEVLERLLLIFRYKHMIPSITVNAKELLKEDFRKKIEDYIEINHSIYGLGISYSNDPRCKEIMLKMKRAHPANVIIHTIAGITSPEDYLWLKENRFKILVLGYKDMGRGIGRNDFNQEYFDWIKDNVISLRVTGSTLSLDCLAVKQLEVEKKIPSKDWETHYMGDDGKFTMFADLVKKQYAVSSTMPHSQRTNITMPASQYFQSLQKTNN